MESDSLPPASEALSLRAGCNPHLTGASLVRLVHSISHENEIKIRIGITMRVARQHYSVELGNRFLTCVPSYVPLAENPHTPSIPREAEIRPVRLRERARTVRHGSHVGESLDPRRFHISSRSCTVSMDFRLLCSMYFKLPNAISPAPPNTQASGIRITPGECAARFHKGKFRLGRAFIFMVSSQECSLRPVRSAALLGFID